MSSHSHHHHTHHHDHSTDRGRRALVWSLILNGGFFLIEAVVGVVTGSLALLSDAAHMLGDVGALAVALLAAQLARMPTSAQQTYGLRRAEVLGGFLNGLTMLGICVWIGWEALSRLALGAPDVTGMPIFLVGLCGLSINLASAWMLYRADRDNLNIRGALLHMLADALGSLGAMIAALLVMAGFPAADPIVSLLIAALVLFTTVRLLQDAACVLLQLPPSWLNVQDIADAICDEEGVVDVHALHVWTLDGQTPVVTAHLVIDDMHRVKEVRPRVDAMLRHRFNVENVTLQVDDVHSACAHSAHGVQDTAGAARCDQEADTDHAHHAHHHAHAENG